MTTFTVTVDDHVALFIRRVAVREQKDETLAAAQLLEWAANRRGANEGTNDDAPVRDEGWNDDEDPSLAPRHLQIRQIFERNEWPESLSAASG